MKKTTLRKTIAAVITAATVASIGTGMTVSASAEALPDDMGYAYNESLGLTANADAVSSFRLGGIFEDVLDHSCDPKAPDVSVSLLDKLLPLHKDVHPYNVQVGKYYVIKDHKQIGRHTLFKFRLVKVTKNYEDPTWYGSERTIVIRGCDNGKTKTLTPLKFLEVPTLFYEVDDFLIK